MARKSATNTSRTSKDTECPFEWLTSAESLGALLKPRICGLSRPENACDMERSALHLGCGDSVLGEVLIQELGFSHVVNVDRDADALDRIENRWGRRLNGDKEASRKMEFVRMDFSESIVVEQIPSEYFDLAVDKSTLDFVMCSNDDAAAGLLCLAHDSLKVGGIYVVVSFHDYNFISRILKDCPGATWTVGYHAMPRIVEASVSSGGDLDPESENEKATGVHQNLAPALEASSPSNDSQDHIDAPATMPSVWSSGTFDPSSNYRKHVSVLICEKQTAASAFDRDLVHQHIQSCNNHWFQSSNPMLTPIREARLKIDWMQEDEGYACSSKQGLLDMMRCYNVLFTDAEREHLTFEHFMEDWNAFLETRSDIPRNKMSFETALEFLKEMQ